MAETWDEQVQLITYQNAISAEGVSKKTKVPCAPIFCQIKSVPGVEFYRAGQSGLKPSAIIVIHPFEYSGESELLHDEKYYTIIRSFKTSEDELELTCEEKLGEKDGN